MYRHCHCVLLFQSIFPCECRWEFFSGLVFCFYFLFLLSIYNLFIVSLQSFLIDQYIYFSDGSSHSCLYFFFALFIGLCINSVSCIFAMLLLLHEDQVTYLALTTLRLEGICIVCTDLLSTYFTYFQGRLWSIKNASFGSEIFCPEV